MGLEGWRNSEAEKDSSLELWMDSGVEPPFVIARGRKRDTPFVPYFAIAANLND
jgi:hypothetical protein